MELGDKIKLKIRDIQDFPRKGIVFRDITPVLQDHELCQEILLAMADHYSAENINGVVGIESRGFIFGMLLAYHLNVPFIPVRKEGKLPYTTFRYEYALEYGEATLEIHKDAISPGDRVVIHDDLLATGGTARAARQLVEYCGGEVSGFSFIIEILSLHGRKDLEPLAPLHVLAGYE